MRKILLAAITLAYPSIAYLQTTNGTTASPATQPITFITQLDTIDINKTAIDSKQRLILADRFYFKSETPCKKQSISGNPDSFGLNLQAYAKKIKELIPDVLNDRYLLVTLDQCDGMGTPMVTNIQSCTEALCGAEYMKTDPNIWFNDNLEVTVKRQAESVVSLPLVFDKEKQLWKITGWYIAQNNDATTAKGDDAKQRKMAFEGYTDREDFKNQIFVSAFTAYYPSGNVSHTYSYNKEGKKDGEYIAYYDEKDRVAEKAVFKNGLVNGEYTIYHDNGAIESKRQFVDNVIADGDCPHYYPDGKLKENHTYLNHKFEGKAYEYYPDGTLKSEGTYHLGKNVGKETRYYSSGKVEVISNYDQQGKSDGITEVYGKDGQLTAKRAYKKGQQLYAQVWYTNGQMKIETFYDANGRENGVSKEWYENGQLKKSENYKSGVLEGNSQTWYENGQPQYVRPYKAGKSFGIDKDWDEQGKLERTVEYKNDKKNGLYIRYSTKTGKMVKETPYVDDKIHGIEKEFNDRTGKLVKTTPYVKGKAQGTAEEYDVDGLKTLTCYRDGDSKDYLFNARTVKESAKKGDANAQYKLAKYYYTCENYVEGRNLLDKLAKENNLAALRFLAQIYKDGIGVEKNPQTQFLMVKKAAETGDRSSQQEIGYMYLAGIGVDADPAKALPWYIKSAEQGDTYANYSLGWMYENGEGVEPSIEKALSYYNFAAEKGMPEAIEAVKELGAGPK